MAPFQYLHGDTFILVPCDAIRYGGRDDCRDPAVVAPGRQPVLGWCDAKTAGWTDQQMLALNNPVPATVRDVLASVPTPRQRPLETLQAATPFEYATYFPDARSALCFAVRNSVAPDDTVIVPGYTCRAVDRAVAAVAEPVYADISAETYAIAPTEIPSETLAAAEAIVPVHMYGQPCEMAALSRLATRHDLTVIEDAAQALGATTCSDQVAHHSDYCVFSLRFSKEVTTGTGGILLSQRPVDPSPPPSTNALAPLEVAALLAGQYGRSLVPGRLYETLKRRVLEPLFESSAASFSPGDPTQLTRPESVLCARQLERLPAAVERRRRNARVYHDALPAALVGPVDQQSHAYYQFPIRVESDCRDELFNALLRRGIEANRMYPYTLSPTGVCPVADSVADRVLTLPVHERLSPARVRRIAAVVRQQHAQLQ